MERLCHWLAALTGQTLTSDEIPSGGPVLSFVIEDDKGDIKPFGLGVSGGKPRVLGRLDISQAISVDAWRRALKAASDTEPLPAEHEVLNHARTLLLEGDSRGSVIAAGSAAEIALSRALHGRLSSANEPVAVATLMDRTTLGRLPGLSKRFGVPCPPIKRLTDARNDAVHRGVVPFLQDASELLDIADAVVKMHSPLVA